MIRRGLPTRLALLAGALAVGGALALAGRRLGLSEILIVGGIVALVLAVNGLIFLVGLVVKGYRSGLPAGGGAQRQRENN